MPLPTLTYVRARLLSKALMATGLVCAILFILSTRLAMGVLIGSHHAFIFSGGVISWQWTISDWSQDIVAHPHLGPFFVDRNEAPLEWSLAYRDTPLNSELDFPLIYPLLATLLPGLFIALRHRFRPGHCKRCGYDLAGLEPHAPCPECGRPQPG
jgi:hypothetical protein